MAETKRIRDPVHGLITFEMSDEVDHAAWKLINTPEFQRLRRVKQLGMSEFIYPGATHTRLAHSIGVFHVARRLVKVAQKYIPAEKQNAHRSRVALIAALLHDIGHGPFSHAFENAEKLRLSSDVYVNHEDWTAKLICRKEGNIRPILKERFSDSFAEDVADLLRGNTQDLYSSVVSSSFDADRLDYLQRDRMMTGSGAGAIDFDWLLDNLRVVDVPAGSGEDEEITQEGKIQVFAFKEKALQAAETFILARFQLYSQIYLHKTTRGIEQMLTAFLTAFGTESAKGRDADLAVPEDHPLRRYYADSKPDLENYFALDDAVVWSAMEISAKKGSGRVRDFAERICSRGIMKGITIDTVNPEDVDKSIRRFIEERFKSEFGNTVFEDRAPLSIYKDPRKESVKPHKRVYIIRRGGKAVDITSLSKPVEALYKEQEILRYYFVKESDWEEVMRIRGDGDAASS